MISSLSFQVHTTAIYHRARQGFLEGVHRWTMFLVILSSGAALYAFVEVESPDWMRYLPLLPAVLSALDMSFAWNHRAIAHALLARRAIDLAGRIDAEEISHRDALHGFYALVAEEPPEHRAANALAYNQMAERIGSPERIHVPWWQRRLQHVLRFQSSSLKVPGVQTA